MGNPLKGETEFILDGRTYKLVLTVDALCQMEAITKESALVSITNPSFANMRAMLWVGLQEHHRADKITLQEAGDMILKLGWPEMGRLQAELIAFCFPTVVPTAEGQSGPLAHQTSPATSSTGKPS